MFSQKNIDYVFASIRFNRYRNIFFTLNVEIMDITFWVIILVFLMDIAVLYEIVRSRYTEGYKIFCALIILLLPIVGVSIYYLIRK